VVQQAYGAAFVGHFLVRLNPTPFPPSMICYNI
jgi:hypothetical protein